MIRHPPRLHTTPRLCTALLVVLVAVSLLSLAPAALGLEVPFLSGRVMDLGELLDPNAEARIEAQLEALETETGSQVVVLTVPSLEGDPIEDFSIRAAEQWQIGRGAVDDGVLLIISRDDRRLRIEVGYGLEGAIPDARARRIVDGAITPRFKAGDFAGGVEAGVTALGAAIRGEDLPEALSSSAPPPAQGKIPTFLVFFFFVGMFTWAALINPTKAAWAQYVFLMPFHLLFPIGLLGKAGVVVFLAYLIGFPILRAILRATGFLERQAALQKRRGRRVGHGPVIFGSPSSRGGGFGGFGGGGFGGFSGGGGSFGGGGSSGGW